MNAETNNNRVGKMSPYVGHQDEPCNSPDQREAPQDTLTNYNRLKVSTPLARKRERKGTTLPALDDQRKYYLA